MQRKCKICVSIFGSRRTTSHLALKLPSAVWTEPLKTPGCPIPRVTCAATDLCNLDSCVDKCHQETVLLLSVISIFSNSPSTGDFQPVCIGITLFLQPVGGVESPVCREGDGSAGELARGAQLGCHQPRWMVSPKGAAGSDPPSCCSGTVLMDQTASWSCGCSQGMLGDVSGVGPSCGEVTAMEHRWQQGQQVLPVLLRAWPGTAFLLPTPLCQWLCCFQGTRQCLSLLPARAVPCWGTRQRHVRYRGHAQRRGRRMGIHQQLLPR